MFVRGLWHRKLPFAVMFRCLRALAATAALTWPPAKSTCIISGSTLKKKQKTSAARSWTLSKLIFELYTKYCIIFIRIVGVCFCSLAGRVLFFLLGSTDS